MGGWNATAECQTLFPDEIIRDSSEAAPQVSVTNPQNTIKLKKGDTAPKVNDPLKHVPPSKVLNNIRK